MLYLGTSGFAYDDWIGVFYPLSLPKRGWLSFYANEFNTLEINSTFYSLPKPSTLSSMSIRTPPNFLFSVKAHQELTHKRQGNEQVFSAFIKTIEPLAKTGKLGCILAQFPYSFVYSPENMKYLEFLRERLSGFPLVIEFRHISWLKKSVFDFLRRLKIGFCCVDEPQLPRLLPPIAEATGPIAYLRFHGRNAEKWWRHQFAYERYDYTYSEAELAEWLPKIKKLISSAEKTFIFANNHYRGQAIDTIRKLKRMLEKDVKEGSRILPPSPWGALLRPTD